ncbi:hypothetical protein LXM55_17515 [Pseudomonas sp. Au-Pse12]|nr:hypothetical protein [Pseudomonas sp. Au-Pse12]
MAQLLNDIVIAPLKDELTALLDGALYPLDKEIKDRHDGLMAQISKIKRTLDRHYPANSLALDEQFQALLDGQHDAEHQAHTRTNDLATTLSAQTEAFSQQTLQALSSQTEALDGLLSKQQQAFQAHTQAQLHALNDANRLAHHESNERLFEQMSGLADTQQSTEALAVTRAEHLLETLSTQAETLGQQTLQALNTHSQKLEGQLNDHHQAFQLDTQTQLKALSEANQSVLREGNDQLLEQLQQLGKEHTKRLEALITVLASKGRTSVEQAIAQQDQRVQVTLCTQAVQASTQHESTLQTLAAIHQHLLRQDARVDDLQVNLQRTAGHAKALLYTVVPVGLLSLGALAYLILHIS